MHSLYHFSVTLLITLFMCFLGCDSNNVSKVPIEPREYELVWEDNFNDKVLDLSTWTYETEERFLNQQQQNAATNVRFTDTSVQLFLTHDSLNGLPFTSGRIWTKGKYELLCGRVVAKMKLPVGSGYWPSLVLQGTPSWPSCGLITMVVSPGYKDWIDVSIITPENPIAFGSQCTLSLPINTWHEYRIDWEPDSIRWYVDNMMRYTVRRDEVSDWVFNNHAFYLTLSLAIGGDYPQSYNGVTLPYPGIPQSTVENVELNQGMLEVDWIRVYKKKLMIYD